MMKLLKACAVAALIGSSPWIWANDAGSTKPAKTEQVQSQKININTATAAELEALPRIGPAMAQRIVAFREANNGFKKVEELMNVKGIGAKVFDTIAPLVTI
ncbi:MAG: helix-hairpin-helix domain-containing protein [Acidobacteria bacterium]|nr:helix-hairpin-helix domain-containing protein [Acidobacteriota bacterium]